MSRLFGHDVGRDDLRRLTGSPEQVVGAELLERADGTARGTRVVRLRSGELDVEVAVDRALDITHAAVRGLPVTWLSPTGVVAPALHDEGDWGWFRSFFGGLLTTCGLDHTLGPADIETPWYQYPGQPTRPFPLHGRVSSIPARLAAYGIDWDADEPVVFVRGEVRQAVVFGEVLTMEREIRLPIGGTDIRLVDRVRNDGYAPTPHMVLYHINAGWPLLGPDAVVCVRGDEPRFATPAAAGADWRAVQAPSRGVVEQVWEHSPARDAAGWGYAAIANPDVGDGRAAALEIRWDMQSLPRLFQWRVMSETNYTIGLEPGNLPIEGREAAAASGDLVMLDPGASVEHRIVFSIPAPEAASDIAAQVTADAGRAT